MHNYIFVRRVGALNFTCYHNDVEFKANSRTRKATDIYGFFRVLKLTKGLENHRNVDRTSYFGSGLGDCLIMAASPFQISIQIWA